MHHMPFGAELRNGGDARFRLWAPAARRVDLCIESGEPDQPVQMRGLSDGWFEIDLGDIPAGTRYRYLIDSKIRVPDPASRFQPDDAHGPSEVVDSLAFEWSDDGWHGRPWEDAVIYELHVGAFTRRGTFAGVIEKLDHLVDLGVTAVELMPVAEVPGRRNWGYDGVLPFAPESAYGSPNALKGMIDAAHGRGLMVFLDVVYSHFGPDGNYLGLYAPQFFTGRHPTPWGAAIDFEHRPVRDFFIHNALYWIAEYHIDGLRLDAVHAIYDESEPDILTELAETVRAEVTGRHVHLVLENDDNAPKYLMRDKSLRPVRYTAQWDDDIHHALHVLTTKEEGGYYADYRDRPIAHLGRALTEGYAYQGEISEHRGGKARGAPSCHLPPSAFISFLQNHDQIGNRAFGERLAQIVETVALRAAAAVLLLAPSPPLLFMGEEWGAKQPFPFFCDFRDDLAAQVRDGRRQEFARFPEFQDAKSRERIPDPNAVTTFERAVLDWTDLQSGESRQWLEFYRRLLRLRGAEIVPLLPRFAGYCGTFDTYGESGLVTQWRATDGSALCLYANLGGTPLDHAPLAPEGRVIAAVGDGMARALSNGSWPAWSVAWIIASEREP